MNPGRELDAKIMKHVLTDWHFCKSSFEQYEPSSWSRGSKFVWGAEFSPSTNIDAAWEVVKKMPFIDMHLYFGLENRPEALNEWVARFGKFSGEGATATHAICIAALKAVNAL